MEHQDMKMAKAGCDCLAVVGPVVMAAFGGHGWDHDGRPGKLGPPPS